MDDYSSEVSEDPITSLLSLRSYCLAVQKHTLKDGCEAQTKTSHSKCTQWAITWSWKTIACLFFFLFHIFQNVLLILSRLCHSHQNPLNLMQESPHNPLSTPPPSPSCIPQIQTDWVYVYPMNESIFSFQHCLNFQLKMSTVSPDRSEGPSITRPLLAPSQAHVSATLFMIILHYKACFKKNTQTHTIYTIKICYIRWMDTQTGHKRISYCNKPW